MPLTPGKPDLPPYYLLFWALPPGQSATDAILARRQAAALAPPQRGLSPARTPPLPLQLPPPLALPSLERSDAAPSPAVQPAQEFIDQLPLRSSPSPSPPSLKTADGATDDGSDDGSDDDSVIFVSENPATQEGDNTALHSEADDGDDIAGAENNVLEALAASLYTADDVERWAATCRLFCHDIARTAHDEGAQLPGTNFQLHPYQMEAVYEQLQRSFGEGLGGGIIALDTGLGRTVIILAVAAVMRLAELNAAEVRRDARITGLPDRAHNEPGTTTACPSNNPWGIECCCVSGSLTDHIVHGLALGPSLVLTPANVVEQFAQQGSAYLARVIQLPGSASDMSFIDTIDTSTAWASLAKEVQADILVDFVGERPEYSAPKTGKPPALVPGSGSEMGYTAAQKSRLFDRHRLIVVSSNPHSVVGKGKGCGFFARAYQLRQQKRRRRSTTLSSGPWRRGSSS